MSTPTPLSHIVHAFFYACICVIPTPVILIEVSQACNASRNAVLLRRVDGLLVRNTMT